MEQTTLQVDGMACDGCEQNVIDALESLSGIASATADHAAGRVRVEHERSLADETTIASAIEDAGYEVFA